MDVQTSRQIGVNQHQVGEKPDWAGLKDSRFQIKVQLVGLWQHLHLILSGHSVMS